MKSAIREIWDEVKWLVLILGVILVVLFSLLVLRAKFESEAYNRLTGANTTTWDALLLELRVQEGAK